jgi:tRNA G18 (ribose-2'-O)-methylase SpoU
MVNIETRNIINYYAYWDTEAIKADLDKKRHPFSVLVSNKFNDFNLGGVIRNANAFLAKEVIIYGRKQYDRRGTVGTHIYSNLKHIKEIEAIADLRYPIIGVDNIDSAVPIETFQWPEEHFIMAFGQEDIGLSEEITNICQQVVYIQQYGSVRSLNVGCASAIAMYDWAVKWQKLNLH